MKKTIIDMKDMSDSKELYGQRPNPFIPAFLYCLAALFLVGLIYSFFGKIEMVASASGVVRPNDDVGTVSCLLGGKITEVCYSDGQLVHEGDKLLTVDTSELQITLDSLIQTQEDYQTQISMLDRFLEGIETGENPFSSDPESQEYSYYIQFRNYNTTLKNAHNTLAYDKDKVTANVTSIRTQISQLQKKIAGFTSYKDSVVQGKNLAAEDPEYADMYALYESQMAAIDAEYQKARSELESSYQTGQVEDTEKLDAALKELEISHQNARDTQYYQTITGIDTTLQSLESELNTAQSTLQQYELSMQQYNKSVDETGTPLSVSAATLEQTSSLLNSRETVQKQLEELETQIQKTQAQIDQGTITASCSGIVNVLSAVVVGDTIASGTSIATIIPFQESEYKVQMYVSNSDIANIEVGDTIRYNLAALPSNQYGTICGTVTNVSSDAVIQDGQYSGYFLVEGSIANQELIDQDGNVGSVAIGMQTDAKIVVQNKTILRYLLEKINLF